MHKFSISAGGSPRAEAAGTGVPIRKGGSGCESARGPDADRRAKLLIRLAMEGALFDAYSHQLTIGGIAIQNFGPLISARGPSLSQISHSVSSHMTRQGKD
jgi:hypothetical protein